MFKKLIAGSLTAAFMLSVSAYGQRDLGVRPTDSGGVLSAEQAAYDVKHYDLTVEVDVQNQSINGVLLVKAKVLKTLKTFVLDLDPAMKVDEILLTSSINPYPMRFEHKDGKLRVNLPDEQKKGAMMELKVFYGGKPKLAPRPPWVGGFVWSKTADGQPWLATAVQNDGADLWFPVKDHPSDKPDTMKLHFTVPANLVAAANGRLESVTDNKDGTKTFNWFISQPISNYCVALNVAPYKLVEDSVKSITGETIPIKFYVLPQDESKAQSLIDLTKKYNAFFEEYLGPYPFRADKIGIAETPHLGMEHQSITAYGNEFKYNADGEDWLMFHEFGHEWWANLVTAPDWNDFWIHEGFQSFMDTFYLEKTKGKDAYFAAMKARYKNLRNVKPVAPREPQTTTQIYMLPPEYTKSDGDIYGKGAMILHALRYYVGDEAFFKTLRRVAYPDPKMERVKDGKQFHFMTTDGVLKIAEQQSGKKLGWFFEVYLRQPKLPTLNAEVKGNQLNLSWETPNKLPFALPIDVKIGDEIKRVELKNGKGSVALGQDGKYEIDPHGWVLRQL